MDVTAGKKAKEAAVRLIGRHPFAEGIAPRRMRNGVKKVDRTDGREKGAGERGKKDIERWKRCVCSSFCAQKNFMKMKNGKLNWW